MEESENQVSIQSQLSFGQVLLIILHLLLLATVIVGTGYISEIGRAINGDTTQGFETTAFIKSIWILVPIVLGIGHVVLWSVHSKRSVRWYHYILSSLASVLIWATLITWSASGQL